MPSFNIPLSGLDADSTALNTIANNLSNMSTTGFKTQTTNFSDLMYQQIGSNGSGDEIQVGTGVQVASNSTNFTGGSIASTDVSTNAAIDGAGFFILDDKGSQLYTRDGDFQTSAAGTLESSNGLAVMGYSATNGVVNTSGGLTDLAIPTTGTVMAPSATTSFGLTQNLDSADAVGATYSGTVTVYDSMGTAYTANVAYTKTGTDQWSYNITMPDTLSVNPATAATVTDTVTPTSATSGTNTIYTYDFGSSGGTLASGSSSGTLATVAPSTTLSFGGSSVTIPAAGESVSALAAQINALGVTGVSASVSNGTLTVTAPTATTVASAVSQDLTGATITYNFGSSSSTYATVNTGTDLTLSGLTSAGATATITAPTVTSGESLTTYATALTSALSSAGIEGVSVSANNGTLSITGANMSTSGSVLQDPVASANTSGTLTFDASGNLISPSTDVSNVTFAGLSDGAASVNMTWDLFGSTGKGLISQTDVASNQSAETQNGYASGTFNSTFSINSDGLITADYTNGQDQAVGQIALATVSNEQGLADVGSTEYATTSASGLASVGAAGSDGLGSVEGSSLEASNVNISAEFSDLIVAQRAFEANAKSVTTFDTITQETINMIH
jgi:flagellar hook protein FlgE